jgi:5'-deoxynucleotidase YfbR-like HD superfamily hydrolase
MSWLYDRVRLAREGAAVERAHNTPHLMRYSVGQHSLDLVTLITLCWQVDHGGQLPRAELLVAAAFHDVPERITGDPPSPVKSKAAVLYGAMDDNIQVWLGVQRPALDELTVEEETWLHAADRIELALWGMEEARRGNTAVLPWVEGYKRKFQKHVLPPALALLWAEACDDAMSRLDDEDLMEIVKSA